MWWLFCVSVTQTCNFSSDKRDDADACEAPVAAKLLLATPLRHKLTGTRLSLLLLRMSSKSERKASSPDRARLEAGPLTASAKQMQFPDCRHGTI